MPEFRKLLVANRGEIAIRVFRSAHELGIRTVAIYSHEDRFATHRLKADEAYQVGGTGEPIRSYLNIPAIVALAKEKGVDAIHPGYGFLSENAAFARACEKAGITFVGPRSELLDQLGDKIAARAIAEKAGVPILGGTPEPVVPGPAAKDVAEKLGLPVIIKASMGGGGRGMRVVEKAEDLDPSLDQARREAQTAFGCPDVFLESFIRRAKHIEVQLLGDSHGHLVHLYERDCSVQRRHQKVVEIAPAVGLDPAVRQAVLDAAIAIGSKVGYDNAGTVEFLVDDDTGKFFFIEVNPRIQVEHTVTEMVTGVDLVKSQILIAQGAPLSDPEINLPNQESVKLDGFAFQCRITTEDPENKFTPDYGRITHYRSAGGLGIRLDGGPGITGGIVTPFYDSLLVKVSAQGRRFVDAVARMERALQEFRIRGVKTNIPFLLNVIEHPDFRAGKCTTRFIDQTPDLFKFPVRQDRATKLLTYAADVTVNGFPGRREARELRRPGRARPAEIRRHREAARRLAPEVPGAGPGEVLGLGPRARAVAAHRHDLPRRPSIAPRDAAPHPRHAPRGRRLLPTLPWAVFDRDVGRRDVRHVHAVPQGRPLGPPGAAPKPHPQHPVPDVASRLECRGVHELSRQRRQGVRQGVIRRRNRPVPRVRLAQLGAQHGRGPGGRPRGRGPVRGRHLLHGRHPQSRPPEV